MPPRARPQAVPAETEDSDKEKSGNRRVIRNIDAVRPDVIEEVRREGDARRLIALRLVWAYLGLLLLSVIIPVILYLIVSRTSTVDAVATIKDLSAPLTAGVSSVTGVIGFVLGYYFKSEEKK